MVVVIQKLGRKCTIPHPLELRTLSYPLGHRCFTILCLLCIDWENKLKLPYFLSIACPYNEFRFLTIKLSVWFRELSFCLFMLYDAYYTRSYCKRCLLLTRVQRLFKVLPLLNAIVLFKHLGSWHSLMLATHQLMRRNWTVFASWHFDFFKALRWPTDATKPDGFQQWAFRRVGWIRYFSARRR